MTDGAMPSESPHLILIAGPNGAGKSTAAPILLRDFLGVVEFVNADAIAIGLSSFQPETVAIHAGRIMLKPSARACGKKGEFRLRVYPCHSQFRSLDQRAETEEVVIFFI